MNGTRAFMGMALRHPRHWPALLGLAWSVRRRRWWARPPFLPLPPQAYLAWREETAWHPADLEPSREGEATGVDREALTLEYVSWAAEMRRLVRRRPGPPQDVRSSKHGA